MPGSQYKPFWPPKPSPGATGDDEPVVDLGIAEPGEPDGALIAGPNVRVTMAFETAGPGMPLRVAYDRPAPKVTMAFEREDWVAPPVTNVFEDPVPEVDPEATKRFELEALQAPAGPVTMAFDRAPNFDRPATQAFERDTLPERNGPVTQAFERDMLVARRGPTTVAYEAEAAPECAPITQPFERETLAEHAKPLFARAAPAEPAPPPVRKGTMAFDRTKTPLSSRIAERAEAQVPAEARGTPPRLTAASVREMLARGRLTPAGLLAVPVANPGATMQFQDGSAVPAKTTPPRNMRSFVYGKRPALPPVIQSDDPAVSPAARPRTMQLPRPFFHRKLFKLDSFETPKTSFLRRHRRLLVTLTSLVVLGAGAAVVYAWWQGGALARLVPWWP
jgi:hypothetical protein